MKKILCIIVVCMVAHTTQAQFSELAYDTLIGGNNVDRFAAIQRDPFDSTIIVCGHTKSMISGNHGDYDAWVVKYNPGGDIAWSLCVGTIHSEFFTSIVILPSGDYVAVGSFDPFIGALPDGFHGNNDIIVAKISKNGILMWHKYIGGSLSDLANKVIVGSSGTCVIVGETTSFDGDFQNCIPYGGIDSFSMIIDDSLGNIISVKNFGGSSQDRIKDVVRCFDGTYAFAGWTMSNIAGNHSSQPDMWVVKVDSSICNTLWERCIGTELYEIGGSIIQSLSGDLFVGGYAILSSTVLNGDISSSQFRGQKDGIIAKVTNTGNLSWIDTYGGTNDDYDLFLVKNEHTQSLFAFGITNSTDMQVPVSTDEDVWFFIFDENGTVLDTMISAKTGYDVVEAMVPLPGNHFLAVGEYAPDYVTAWDAYITGTSQSFQPRVTVSVVTSDKTSQEKNFITMYPNPTNDMLYIEIGDNSFIEIYAISGEKIYSKAYADGIDMSFFPKGLYIVEIRNNTIISRQRVQKL